MSKFILIPKHVVRYGLADVMMNLDTVVSITSRDERDIPMIVFELGIKEVKIGFENVEVRDHFLNFIHDECKPVSSALPEAVTDAIAVKATEKKRRTHARD